jgi:transcriptional regulator
MLRAIVGVELKLTSLEGKWKLSQNRDEADREGVRAGLAAENPDIARAMP